MVPLAPTAQTWVASSTETPSRLLPVGSVCVDHVSPASVVLMMVPLAPTAQPVVASSMSTPLRLADVGAAVAQLALTLWVLVSASDRLVRLAALIATGVAGVPSVPDVGL